MFHSRCRTYLIPRQESYIKEGSTGEEIGVTLFAALLLNLSVSLLGRVRLFHLWTTSTTPAVVSFAWCGRDGTNERSSFLPPRLKPLAKLHLRLVARSDLQMRVRYKLFGSPHRSFGIFLALRNHQNASQRHVRPVESQCDPVPGCPHRTVHQIVGSSTSSVNS
jgi:hypothetical protein